MSQPPQQFCVRWNSYHTNLQTVFPKLLTTENFVDVTLACENRQIKCHKVVLSACSTYFERLLIQNPCKHPIIFMKDMRFSEMQSLVDFMYKGEVNVSQDDLPSLLKSAEALQIRGLCGSESAGGGGGPQDTPVAPSPQIAIPLLTSHAATDTSPRDSAEGNVNNNTVAKPNPPPPPSPNASSNASSSPLSRENGQAKRRREGDGESSPEAGKTRLKQETVEEDGLYYGDIDLGEMECNDHGEEDLLQTGTISGQPSAEYAIANVMCEYDTSRSPSPAGTPVTSSVISNEDHNYNAQNLHVIDSCEPPAFIIKQDDPHAILSPNNAHLNQQLLAMSQKLLAATGSSQQHKPIQPQQPGPLHQQHGPSHQQQQHSSIHQQHGSLHYSYGSSDPGNTKRIRRSEVLLKQAADCVSRGQTFQTVSDQFNIPISTIRFFMARKGILPRRKRGRSSAALPVSPNDPRHLSSAGQSQSSATPPSPTQPPYHMATYKLPDFDLGRVS